LKTLKTLIENVMNFRIPKDQAEQVFISLVLCVLGDVLINVIIQIYV
jgi:hypothetical protein